MDWEKIGAGIAAILLGIVQWSIKREIKASDDKFTAMKTQIADLEKADKLHYEKLTQMIGDAQRIDNKISEQTGQFREMIANQNTKISEQTLLFRDMIKNQHEKIELMLDPIIEAVGELKSDVKTKADKTHSKDPRR
jgi:flagellar capping protein FliD